MLGRVVLVEGVEYGSRAKNPTFTFHKELDAVGLVTYVIAKIQQSQVCNARFLLRREARIDLCMPPVSVCRCARWCIQLRGRLIDWADTISSYLSAASGVVPWWYNRSNDLGPCRCRQVLRMLVELIK